MIDLVPSLGLHCRPPIIIFFIAGHDDVINVYPSSLTQFTFDFVNPPGYDRYWSETIQHCNIATPVCEIAVTNMHSNPLDSKLSEKLTLMKHANLGCILTLFESDCLSDIFIREFYNFGGPSHMLTDKSPSWTIVKIKFERLYTPLN